MCKSSSNVGAKKMRNISNKQPSFKFIPWGNRKTTH